jgi:glucokinase
VSADGRIRAHRAQPTEGQASALLAELEAMVYELRDDATAAIGAGVPGRVDARSGRVLSGGYVDLSSLDLTARLRQTTGLPAFADNDASMALVAEARLGAARGHDNAIMLTIGTGIGGAILSDGRIFHGGGAAGQLGHITVNIGGGPCKCGRFGCLETESSGTALRRHMREGGFPDATGVGDLLNANTVQARAVIAAWAAPLRAGIDSLAAAFAPQIIILGGGLGAAASEAVARQPALSPWFQCKVAAAELGDEAGVIGAALAALERFP